ncbi:MAG: hypothetical protein AMXMBFR20_29710 [Planctomycetia bacterium]
MGIDVRIGEARFTSRQMVETGGQTLRLPPGARAASLPIPGLAGEEVEAFQ